MLLFKAKKKKKDTLQKQYADTQVLKHVPFPFLQLEKQVLSLGIISIISDSPNDRHKYCFKID